MADQEDDTDDFDISFQKGEETAISSVKEMIKELRKQFPKKTETRERLYCFSGMSAGYISAMLFHSYMEMIRLLEEAGDKSELAEFWCQKVVTTFGQAVADRKIPVSLNFLIKRG